MGKVNIKALRTDTPGNSLALWLAGTHPDLFVTLLRQARAAKASRSVKGLGDDEGGGILTTFDAPDTFNPSLTSSFESPSFEPNLISVTLDDSALDSLSPNLLTEANSDGFDALSNLASTPTSSGGTLSGALANQGSTGSLLSSLAAVGHYVTSQPGINALTSLTNAVVGGIQGQVLQTQIARTTAANQLAAPISYTRDAAGNLIPAYATPTPAGTLYQPLTPAGVSSLAPSTLSVLFAQYGTYILLGAAAVVAYAIIRR